MYTLMTAGKPSRVAAKTSAIAILIWHPTTIQHTRFNVRMTLGAQAEEYKYTLARQTVRQNYESTVIAQNAKHFVRRAVRDGGDGDKNFGDVNGAGCH